MREVPSCAIVSELAPRGAAVQAYDPAAMEEAKRTLEGVPRLTFAADQQLALRGADALVIATEWKEFRNPDFEHLKSALKSPLVFDGRNLYDPSWMKQMGIEYRAIGRP